MSLPASNMGKGKKWKKKKKRQETEPSLEVFQVVSMWLNGLLVVGWSVEVFSSSFLRLLLLPPFFRPLDLSPNHPLKMIPPLSFLPGGTGPRAARSSEAE